MIGSSSNPLSSSSKMVFDSTPDANNGSSNHRFNSSSSRLTGGPVIKFEAKKPQTLPIVFWSCKIPGISKLELFAVEHLTTVTCSCDGVI